MIFVNMHFLLDSLLIASLCLQKIGKYLKQTAKALEQQVDREAIFYGALMRYITAELE